MRRLMTSGMMGDIDIAEVHEAAAAEAMRLARGMMYNAVLLKRYYELFQAEGVPEPVILIAIEQWYQARIRMEVTAMQQHPAQEAKPE